MLSATSMYSLISCPPTRHFQSPNHHVSTNARAMSPPSFQARASHAMSILCFDDYWGLLYGTLQNCVCCSFCVVRYRTTVRLQETLHCHNNHEKAKEQPRLKPSGLDKQDHPDRLRFAGLVLRAFPRLTIISGVIVGSLTPRDCTKTSRIRPYI